MSQEAVGSMLLERQAGQPIGFDQPPGSDQVSLEQPEAQPLPAFSNPAKLAAVTQLGEIILNFGSSVRLPESGHISPKYITGARRGLDALPDVVPMASLLLGKVQDGTPIGAADITPDHVWLIKKELAGPGVRFVGKLAAGARVMKIRGPERALDEAIVRRTVHGIEEARAKVADIMASPETAKLIAEVEKKVELLADSQNPQDAIRRDAMSLANVASQAIISERDRRVTQAEQSGVVTQEAVPTGTLGFLTKVVRKIRNFFGFFKRRHQPAINHDITAYDAAAGIQQTITSLADPRVRSSVLPTISGLLPDTFQLPAKLLNATTSQLALVAPEILNFLFSLSPDDKKFKSIKASVDRNPHELRFATHMSSVRLRFNLDTIRNASLTLMPAIYDVLPTDGTKVREIFNQVLEVLQKQPTASPDSYETSQQPAAANSRKQHVRNLFRKLKFRRRNQETKKLDSNHVSH